MAEKTPKEGEQKSSKKMIIIIVIALLVLAGAGGGVYFFMGGNSDSQEESADEEAQAEKPKQAVDLLYYDLSKPLIVNFPSGSWARLMQVSVSFLVDGQAAVDSLSKHEPMIRNNLLMLISAQNIEELNTYEGKEKLRKAMLDEVNSVLQKMAGQRDVKEIFFTAFVMQ